MIYILILLIAVAGFFICIISDNYLRKLIGINILQNSIILFYVALSKVNFGIVPIDICGQNPNCVANYSSPLPHVFMLTAIVVGFANFSIGLALLVKIYKNFASFSERKINKIITESIDYQ